MFFCLCYGGLLTHDCVSPSKQSERTDEGGGGWAGVRKPWEDMSDTNMRFVTYSILLTSSSKHSFSWENKIKSGGFFLKVHFCLYERREDNRIISKWEPSCELERSKQRVTHCFLGLVLVCESNTTMSNMSLRNFLGSFCCQHDSVQRVKRIPKIVTMILAQNETAYSCQCSVFQG